MNRFATSLIKKPVILNTEQALVGFVENLVVNPENGELIGILVREGFGKKAIKAVAMKDVLGFADRFILIDGYNSLGELDEIVRIKEVLEKEAKILKNKTYTVSGNYLGKVYDYTINFEEKRIGKIYIRPHIVHTIARDFIIDFKQIISIEKDKIIVEDTSVGLKKSMKIPKAAKPEVGGI